MSEPRNLLPVVPEEQVTFRRLVDSLPEMVWISGHDKGCTFFNKPWLAFTGRSMEEELGNGWADQVHPDDLERCWDVYSSHFERREPFSMEYRLKRHDGEYRWLLNRGNPWFDERGRFGGFVGSCYDVTDTYLMQDEIQRREQQLAHVDRLRTLGEMAAGLAHELNQPLYSIRNYAQGCIRRLESGQEIAHEDLLCTAREIVAVADRAAEVVRRLKDFGKGGPSQRQRVDVNQLIGDLMPLIDMDARQAQVKVRFCSAQQQEIGWADGIQIQQVIMNLVRNAIESMRNQSYRFLSIHTSRQRGEIVVGVADTGCGLPEDLPPGKIFEPFVSTREGGMGMGLAISHSIIENHEGRLWAEPKLDGPGSLFCFTIPVAENATNACART